MLIPTWIPCDNDVVLVTTSYLTFNQQHVFLLEVFLAILLLIAHSTFVLYLAFSKGNKTLNYLLANEIILDPRVKHKLKVNFMSSRYQS